MVDKSGRLDESNIGLAMLKKLGWTAGQGLGLNNNGTSGRSCPQVWGIYMLTSSSFAGRVDPVPSSNSTGLAGIGKARQDANMLDNTALLPKAMTSERIAKETVDQRLAREVSSVQSLDIPSVDV